ncbi:hypothetical protein C5B42_05735, partial [Candidatus Cerribacteria bacterium 'Amazon FNV 2010 28 9']
MRSILVPKLKTLLVLSILIFLCNLVLKSVFIASIPPILTNDEAYYATEAQAIIASGSDVSGTWHPWQLAPANPLYSELTGTLYIPGFLLFPHHTQIAMKVVPILFGSLLPIVLGLIVYKFFKRKVFFVTTALIATCNPWIFQFSRMSFDSFPGIFFYFLGIVGILYLKGWKVLLACIPFFLGFYQYQGYKPLLVPLVLLTVVCVMWKENGGDLRRSLMKYVPHLMLLGVCCALVGIYSIRLPHLLSSSRIGEFAINTAALGQTVTTNRRVSFANPFTLFFENKPFTLINELKRRFVASFDLAWLFEHRNDTVDTFAVTAFGFLYEIDFLLILYVISQLPLQKNWRLLLCFFGGLIVFGTLANVLKDEQLWLTFRGGFTIIGFVLVASIGFGLILQLKKKFVSLALIGCYALFVGSFFYQYFFRYPLLATKDFFFYNRVVANYIERQPNRPIVIFTQTPKILFDDILAYNHLITQQTLPALHIAYQQQKFGLNMIQLQEGCFDPRLVATESGTTVLVDYRVSPCPSSNPLATASAKPV